MRKVVNMRHKKKETHIFLELLEIYNDNIIFKLYLIRQLVDI